jgi:xanthine phosphoribosyltransferase
MNDHLDFPVSWDDIHRDTKALAWRLKEVKEWKGIIAVTRGGMVPACIVARILDIKLIETFCINSYDHKDQGQAKVMKQADVVENEGDGWLVIDDLVDTGNTFEVIRKHLPKAHYGCVYAKPAGAAMTDTFVTEVSQNTWINFPWEVDGN